MPALQAVIGNSLRSASIRSFGKVPSCIMPQPMTVASPASASGLSVDLDRRFAGALGKLDQADVIVERVRIVVRIDGDAGDLDSACPRRDASRRPARSCSPATTGLPSSTRQCAAVSTHCGAIRLPPQNCASGCEFGLSSSRSRAEQRDLERPRALGGLMSAEHAVAGAFLLVLLGARVGNAAHRRGFGLARSILGMPGLSHREAPSRAPAATRRRTV